VKLPLFFFLVSIISAAADPPNPPPSGFDPGLLGGANPALTDQEKAGVAITQAWRDKSLRTLVGEPGQNSSVQFRFGESLPSIVCAILQVTDIQLETGETATHINVGDATRWSVESAVSGSGSEQTQHLMVKPRDIGLSTSLVVTTDRRTYHLLLVSDDAQFMHWVTFIYSDRIPETPTVVAQATPAATVADDPPPARSAPAHPRKPTAKKQVSFTEAKDDADDSYTVNGRAEWKPVTVYSKDGKTFLQMPQSVRHKEAPVLFELKRSGWFHHEKVLVNYRVHDRWYVVDRVLDNATLVSGVGAAQQKVDIRHVPTPPIKEAANPNGK
jgi:type IV secretion system protein TrbG